MDDLAFILGAIGFFVIAIAYVAACAGLQRRS
jgi:hypothetical protein